MAEWASAVVIGGSHATTRSRRYPTTSASTGLPMKKHVMSESKEGGVNVTPLIDIVMCLIIFFMLVAKIGVADGRGKITPPTTAFGVPVRDIGNTLTLNVNKVPVGANEPRVTAMLDSHSTQPR